MLFRFLLPCLALAPACITKADRAAWGDADGDGYVDVGNGGDDCDDARADVNPGASEATCNGRDDDCDDATADAPNADRDDYTVCSDPADCADDDPAIHPGAAERCDGVDDDCDGLTDPPESEDASTWYADDDGDGYGDPDDATAACELPDGYVADDQDCDDADASVNPRADETWYDDLDADCAGDDDFDQDGDGHDAAEHGGDDCDDTRSTTNPDAEEVCGNRSDDDCDGGPGDCVFPDTLGVGDAEAMITGPFTHAGFARTAAQLVLGTASDLYLCDATESASASDCGVVLSLSEAGPVTALALPGDVDDDGYEDLYVGGADDSNSTGSVWFLPGPLPSSGSIPDVAIRLAAEGDESSAAFVGGSGSAGDLDGDGRLDIAFGAPGSVVGQIRAGAVYELLEPPSASATLAVADRRIVGAAPGDYLGDAITIASDLDGDGLTDLVALSRRATNDGGSGAIWVFLDGSETSISDADHRLLGEGGETLDAGSLDGGGDLDGDGDDDVVVGAPEAWDGVVYVLTVADLASGSLGSVATRLGLDGSGDELGASVSIVGDVTGDDSVDLLVGAPNRDSTGTDNGVAFLVPGSFRSSGWITNEALGASQLFASSDGGNYGATVTGGADASGDGTADFVVTDPETGGAGAAYVYLGRGL